MLIRNKKAFSRGLVLMFSFLAVFVMFFMPIFPTHEGGTSNGLVYADNLFNTLSKGSSYFFDPTATDRNSVEFRIRGIQGAQVEVDVPFKDAEQQALVVQMIEQTGALQVTAAAGHLTIKGDLHTLLLAMVTDANAMFHNNANEVAARHGGADGKKVLRAWWQFGTNMIKPLQKKEYLAEARAVSAVLTRAIEPSYNFFGIQAMNVRDNVPLVAGFLIFYVVYTMWYGFAIFELFEGIGLTMKKGVKQEV